MQVVTPQLIQDRRVLLRYDLDIPLARKSAIGSPPAGRAGRQSAGNDWTVADDFRLQASLNTLKLCLNQAASVIVMGHVGRPQGKDSNLSVAPIINWFEEQLVDLKLPQGKLHVLENLRFEKGESFDTAQDKDAVLEYAKELAKLGDFFVNESFAAYRPAASTTVLPTLLPHAAGLRFAHEVEVLTRVRENPKKPLVVIIGGVKVEDKLPVIEAMSKIADAVLVGGKLVSELAQGSVAPNVLVGKLNEQGTDIAPETTQSWAKVIMNAKMIVWNGPMGRVEEEGNDQSRLLAQMVIKSRAESIVGGGDTIAALAKWGLRDQFSFVSTGGGGMLKFLADGTLPTIEALK